MEPPAKNSGPGDAAGKPRARGKRWRKAARRAAYGALGLVAILLVIFFLLPVWISNDQGRNYVLQQINRNMRAKIQIDDWSLGWFSGTELKNLTVTLPDGTTLLSCPRVQSQLTLWGILWGRYDIGNTQIDAARVAITRYANHTTSLDALLESPTREAGQAGAAGARWARILRTLRGSLQVGSAVVTVRSAATGESLEYSDVQAQATIASPEAPFHIQISAVGGPGGGVQAANAMLSLNATLPALTAWPAPPWSVLSDVEFSATHIPTGLACDWLNQDVRWADSFDPVLERVHFSNHVTPPLETSRPVLEIRGNRGAFVDAAMLLRAASGDHGGIATLSLPVAGSGSTAASAAQEDHFAAELRPSEPLAHVLACVNPVFAGIKDAQGPLQFHLSELNVTSGNTANVQAAGRIMFPPMEVQSGGLLSDLLKIGGQNSSAAAGAIPVSAVPLRFRISAGNIAYDNFILTCGRRQRISFSGTLGLDGAVHLAVSVPDDAIGTLGSSHVDVLLTGTVGEPRITLPR